MMSSHISTITYKRKAYQLIKRNIDPKENIFTVVIGKNATGKSSLLSYIIKTVRSSKKDDRANSDLYQGIVKIIAITATPFDKFPIATRQEQRPEGIYKYLGFRDSSRYMSKNSQLSKIVNSLVRSTQKSQESLAKLAETFHLLGYQPTLTALYQIKIPSSVLSEPYITDNLKTYLTDFKDFSPERIRETINAVKRLCKYYDLDYEINISLNFTEGGIIRGSMKIFEDICYLMDTGFIVYKDLMLLRNKGKTEASINKTSSGERCVFINLLGIASEIENNSLICVDEPEISLHPEWQEKYMELLSSTFRHYSGCQFIIATHSPQIISKLNKSNCFILTMDDYRTYSAVDYINRSADYQLAKIFKAPGFQNEYLMNETLEILSQISSGSKITDKLLTRAHDLQSCTQNLDPSDPVSKLVSTLKKALVVLGR